MNHLRRVIQNKVTSYITGLSSAAHLPQGSSSSQCPDLDLPVVPNMHAQELPDLSSKPNPSKVDIFTPLVLSRRRAPLAVLLFTISVVFSYSFLPTSSSFLIIRNYKTHTDIPFDDDFQAVHNPVARPLVKKPAGNGDDGSDSEKDDDDNGDTGDDDDNEEVVDLETETMVSEPKNHRISEPSAPTISSVKQQLTATSPSKADGIPPADLPPGHPNAELLGEIRALTTLRPRWPYVNDTPVYTLRSYGPAYSSIIVSHALKVVYIPVFKAGTSTIMWCIAYLENMQEILKYKDANSGERHFALHDMSSPAWQNHTIWNKPEAEIQAVLRDPSYMKFGFVRNPYDRAVSAYIDKVLLPDTSSQEYRHQLYSLFGRIDWNPSQEANSTKEPVRPTFLQFMRAVRNVITQPRVTPPNTFEDNNSRRDLHWRPQSELLHPDLIHLDFVGRFERMEADLEVVLEWMYRHTTRRLPKDLTIKLQATDPNLKATMLETLGEDQTLVDYIQSVYYLDFHRFQYSSTIPDIEGIPHQIE